MKITQTASLLRALCETRDQREKEVRGGQEDASTTVNNASKRSVVGFRAEMPLCSHYTPYIATHYNDELAQYLLFSSI
jgi:hypothetical protein